MKYIKKVVPLLIIVLSLCACKSTEDKTNGTTDTCEHTYSTEWEYTEKEHFHRATCEHKDLTKDNAAHQFTEWELLENGEEEQRGCMVCGYKETRSHTHTYGEWTIKKEPTLTERGKISRVCSKNQTHLEELELPILNESDYTYKVEVPSTCSLKGEASYTYILDKETFKFSVELDYALHSWGAWKMVKKPTKNEEGLLQRVCGENQTHLEEFVLPILNETDYSYYLTPKGCFVDGKETYTYVHDQQSFEIEIPILATGHPFEYRYDAYKHWQESDCEHHLEKEIADHTFKDNKCSVCGYEKAEEDSVIYKLNSTEDGYLASFNPEYTGISITVLDSYLDLPVVGLFVSEENPFDGKNIEKVTIPSSIEIIGTDQFKGFSKLKDVFYNGTIKDWCKIQFTSSNSNPMKFADCFYLKGESYWEEITKIVIPEDITAIRDYQFYGFNHINEFSLPSELTLISNEAFANCSALTEFVIPDNVTILGQDILVGTELKKLTLPILRGNDGYGKEGFIGSLFGVHKMDSMGWMHQEKLASLEELTITKQTILGNYALANLLNLKKLYLPNSLEEVTNKTILSNCPNLEYNVYENAKYLGSKDNPYLLLVEIMDKTVSNFTISDQTKLIYAEAFKNASITEIELPIDLVDIGQGAFDGSSIQSITIPDSISKLKENCFANCNHLEEIILPTALIYASDTSFLNNSIKKASLNLAILPILNENSLEELTLLAGEGEFSLSAYKNIKRVILTDEISDLGTDVLSSCSSLEYNTKNNLAYLGSKSNPYLWLMKATSTTITDAVIDLSVKYIYENAFKDCINITNVHIPKNVERIEKSAFSSCSSLINVYFDTSNLKTIESKAFAYCKSIVSIELPKSLTYIGEGALGGCVRLKSLSLPFVGSIPNPEKASRSTLFGWIFGTISYQDGEYQTKSIPQVYGTFSSDKYSYYFPQTLEEVYLSGGTIYGGVYGSPLKGFYGAFSELSSSRYGISIKKFMITKDVEVKTTQILQESPVHLTTPFEYLSKFPKTKIEELVITTKGDSFMFSGSDFYYIKKVSFVGVKQITHTNYYIETFEDVTLPDDLEEIGNNVFRKSTNLKELVLPKGLKKIGNNAFEATTTLYYLGTEEQWNQIEKSTISSPVYFYSEVQLVGGWHYVNDEPCLW